MTRKLQSVGWLLLVACALLGAIPAPGAEDKKDDEKFADEVIADTMAAYRMAEFGRNAKTPSPEALVAAGSLLRSLKGAKLTKIAEKPTDADGKAAAGEDQATQNYEEQANELFDEAIALATKQGQDKTITELIKIAKARQYRAVLGGPKTINRTIGPNGWAVYNMEFEPHKRGTFGFRASFPMKITVVRSDNSVVIADGVTANDCASHVFGGLTAGHQSVPVTIRVQNLSKQAGTFTLLVN